MVETHVGMLGGGEMNDKLKKKARQVQLEWELMLAYYEGRLCVGFAYWLECQVNKDSYYRDEAKELLALWEGL